MGEIYNKKTRISKDGEILSERQWTSYDGFNEEKGYRYRSRQQYIRYYYDAIPTNLSRDALMMLFMIAEIMTEENMLIYRVSRKSKFSKFVYKPYTLDDIRERLRYPFGKNRFRRNWTELKKHCLKKIKYFNIEAWAVNPAVISKCYFLPDFLYIEFKDYLNPFLTPNAIAIFQNRISEMED